MAFIRPEVSAAIWRWRETLIGVGLAGLGLWVGLGPRGLLAGLGWVAFGGGGILALGGIQRARFRRPGEGPGVVRVTEGQISYMGPLTGGIVARDALRVLSLSPNGHPLHWRLEHDLGPPVMIPVTAKNAEDLFDVFEQLPGLNMGALLAALDSPPTEPLVLWRRGSVQVTG
ncbi:MAG: hypothetical protein ACK5IB_10505 [Qingshengfaniella sp.]